MSWISREVHVQFCERAGVRLPCATHLVVLARYISPQLRYWIEGCLEGWLGLQVNRQKTRVVDLRQKGERLDFLGYTFRYQQDLQGRPWRYCNLEPSRKALAREREALRRRIGRRQCWVPLPKLITEVNRHLRGWANYFGLGYPRQAFRHLNYYVRERMTQHLRRRSQRPWRPPNGLHAHTYLDQLGLLRL